MTKTETTYLNFLTDLEAVYCCFERGFRLYAHGGGWARIQRGADRPKLASESALEKGMEHLTRAKQYAENPADAPPIIRDGLRSVVEQAEEYARMLKGFCETARRSFGAEDARKQWAEIRKRAIDALAECRGNAAIVGREPWIHLERLQGEAKIAEARAAEDRARADMYHAQGETKAAREAARRADNRAREAEEKRREAEKTAASLEGENKTLHESLNCKVETILSAVRGRQRERINYAGLVEAFRDADSRARGYGRGLGQIGNMEAAMQAAMEAAKQTGKIAKNMTLDKFKEMRGKWLAWGCPDAPEFEAKWKAMKRAEKAKKKQ